MDFPAEFYASRIFSCVKIFFSNIWGKFVISLEDIFSVSPSCGTANAASEGGGTKGGGF